MKRYITGLILLLLLLPLPAPAGGDGGTDGYEIENRLPNTTGKERLELLVKLTKFYRERDPKKTLSYGEEAMKLLRDFPEVGQHIRLLNHLSTANGNLSHNETALQQAQRAGDLARSIDDQKGFAESLVNRAVVYRYMSSFEKALKYLTRAREIYGKLGDLEGLAFVSHNMGVAHAKLSNLSKAVENFFRCARLKEKMGDKIGIASAYNNIGTIYQDMDDSENALLYFKKVLDICEETGYKRGMAVVLNNIAFIEKDQRKYTEALEYARQSLALKRELGDQRRVAITLNLIGAIYMDQKETKKAVEYLTESLNISKALNDRNMVADNLIYLGAIAQQSNRLGEALTLLTRAMNIAEEIKTTAQVRDAAAGLSEVHEALGNDSKALLYHKKYKNLYDSIINERNTEKVAELQSRYESDQKEKAIQLLKKNEEINRLNLVRQRTLIKYIIIIGLLVLMVAVMFYTRFRSKVRANRALRLEIEEHNRTTRELMRSRKMEAVGILVGGIAHDFNNLLAVINGYLGIIKDKGKQDNGTLNVVRKIETATLQAAELGEKFITIAMGGWVLPQEFAVNDVLQSTQEHCPTLMPPPAGISLSPGLKTIYGDQRQLRELLANLLQNAADAGCTRNEIKISAANTALENENDLTLPAGDYLRIRVTDTGRGIPADQLDKIFEPYYSTKDTPSQKGLGLGLAVCYAITKRHNGHIGITSEEGAGTTVTVHLPEHRETDTEDQ